MALIDTSIPHLPTHITELCACLFVVFNPLHKYRGGGDLALSLAQFSDSGATIAVNMPGGDACCLM